MQISVLQNCLICKQSSKKLLCEYCRADLVKFECERYQHNLLNWPRVKKGLKAVSFDSVLAVADYQWPLSNLLTGLKFSAKQPHALALGELFHQYAIAEAVNKPDAIIPMPLHNARYYQRRFNQSIEIAKHIGRLSNIAVEHTALKRIKKTTAQTELTASERKANLRNAFGISQSATYVMGQFKHIALFDDVITTGATMDAAYRLLKQHFPHLRIDVWCICLTLEH